MIGATVAITRSMRRGLTTEASPTGKDAADLTRAACFAASAREVVLKQVGARRFVMRVKIGLLPWLLARRRDLARLRARFAVQLLAVPDFVRVEVWP